MSSDRMETVPTANPCSFCGKPSTALQKGKFVCYDHFAKLGKAQIYGEKLLPGVGRNDYCPCHSGKKFKNCHGDPTVDLTHLAILIRTVATLRFPEFVGNEFEIPCLPMSVYTKFASDSKLLSPEEKENFALAVLRSLPYESNLYLDSLRRFLDHLLEPWKSQSMGDAKVITGKTLESENHEESAGTIQDHEVCSGDLLPELPVPANE